MRLLRALLLPPPRSDAAGRGVGTVGTGTRSAERCDSEFVVQQCAHLGQLPLHVFQQVVVAAGYCTLAALRDVGDDLAARARGDPDVAKLVNPVPAEHRGNASNRTPLRVFQPLSAKGAGHGSGSEADVRPLSKI